MAANKIAHGNIELSLRAEQQAATLQETAASIEQLAVTVKSNTAGVQQTADSVRKTAALARPGERNMQRMSETMNDFSKKAR